MKKTIVSIMSILLLSSCMSVKSLDTTKRYPTSSYITKDMDTQCDDAQFSTICLEGKSLKEWSDIADAIVISTIISLDKVELEKKNNAFGYTIGKMLVQDTLHGKNLEGNVLTYAKQGAVMSWAQYRTIQDYKIDYDEIRAQHGGKDLHEIYVSTTCDDIDIRLKEGKT